jgi:uncharacterized protein YecE (DUF72 family)
MPPSLTAKEGLKKLETLIHILDPNLDTRLNSGTSHGLIRASISCSLTTTFVLLGVNWTIYKPLLNYFRLCIDLRFIGDRSIDEKDTGTVQKDRLAELKRWSDSLRSIKNIAKFAIVAANNHYAGFGPSTANSFRKMLGLKEAVWEEMKQNRL